MEKSCECCGKGPTIYTCNKCKVVRYCDSVCERRDGNVHAKQCSTLTLANTLLEDRFFLAHFNYLSSKAVEWKAQGFFVLTPDISGTYSLGFIRKVDAEHVLGANSVSGDESAGLRAKEWLEQPTSVQFITAEGDCVLWRVLPRDYLEARLEGLVLDVSKVKDDLVSKVALLLTGKVVLWAKVGTNWCDFCESKLEIL